jgi:hypothetical protein
VSTGNPEPAAQLPPTGSRIFTAIIRNHVVVIFSRVRNISDVVNILTRNIGYHLRRSTAWLRIEAVKIRDPEGEEGGCSQPDQD